MAIGVIDHDGNRLPERSEYRVIRRLARAQHEHSGSQSKLGMFRLGAIVQRVRILYTHVDVLVNGRPRVVGIVRGLRRDADRSWTETKLRVRDRPLGRRYFEARLEAECGDQPADGRRRVLIAQHGKEVGLPLAVGHVLPPGTGYGPERAGVLEEIYRARNSPGVTPVNSRKSRIRCA